MRTHNLAFIDTETTGLNPEWHELIEIGGVLARQIPRKGKGPELEVVEEFEMKVKPVHVETADPIALEIVGYDEADWTSAVDLKQALIVLAEKTEGCIMVGHNVAFDHSFIEKAYEENGMKNTMHYHKLDTISLAYAKLYDKMEIEKFSLRSLCEYFGIENKRAHTALSDARATFELYKKLLLT
ncbi:MAG: 3'-5' exonuclease [bacterium]|nr:3'-5' exonuclease [bacterium]